MTTKVELHNAYVWDCDACGAENFVRAVTVEMTPEDVEAMKERYGGDDEEWQTGNWMSRPDDVTCSKCGAKFEVEEPEAPERPG